MKTFQLEFQSKFKVNDKQGWITDTDTILAYSKEDAVNKFKDAVTKFENEGNSVNHSLIFKNIKCTGVYNSTEGLDPEEIYYKNVATWNERHSYFDED